MSDSFRASVLATAKRAIASRDWPGLYAVSIECDWADYARAVRDDDQVKVHFWVHYDHDVASRMPDDIDAHLISIVIDEACDYGRRGYASFAFFGGVRPQEVTLRCDPWIGSRMVTR